VLEPQASPFIQFLTNSVGLVQRILGRFIILSNVLGSAENILFPFILAQLSVAKYFLANGDGSAECSRIFAAQD